MERPGGQSGAIPQAVESDAQLFVRVLPGPVELILELEELALRDLLSVGSAAPPPGQRMRRRRLRA